jgi:hypothetical protein
VYYPPPIYYPPPYYGGYYGAWGFYDDDWIWGLAIGTTVAAVAIGASVDDDDDDDDVVVIQTPAPAPAAPAAPQGGLPCNPTISQQEGMTYYLCGQQNYVLAYGGTGPIYIPVPAPEPPAPPQPPAPPPAAPPPAG